VRFAARSQKFTLARDHLPKLETFHSSEVAAWLPRSGYVCPLGKRARAAAQ